MPNFENSKLRGSLYITVDIQFPRNHKLTDDDRIYIQKLFSQTNEEYNNAKAQADSPRLATVYNGLDGNMRSSNVVVTI